MANYHITDDGPRACSTTPDRCPYGQAGGDHFNNVAEAQTNYEKTMEAKHGLVGLAISAKNRQNELYKLYEQMDQVQRDSDTYRKIAMISSYRQSSPIRGSARPYVPKGRSKGYDRMRRNHPGRRISRMATREGKELFKSVGPTPRNVIKLHGYLTRELQNSVK